MIIMANICNGCSYTLIASANVTTVMQDWFGMVIPDRNHADFVTFADGMTDARWEIENPVSWIRRQYTTMALTVGFLLPLTFVNLRKISAVSVMGITATILLVIALVFCCPDNINIPNDKQWEWWNPSQQTIGCFSSFSIAICAHSIAPNFYQALEKRSPSRFAKTTVSGYFIILVLNLVVAICGYVRFGDTVQANILEAYSVDRDDIWSFNAICISIARV